MDSTDEEFYGSTSFTTKGRRTKRQRTAATTTSAFANGGAYSENSYGSSASATPPQSTPDDQDAVSEVTTEEQDLANCLIMLAQGLQKGRTSKIIISTNHISNINNNTNTSSVVGVYECKTCKRTFPSFQALGGHRTSHKKTVKPTTVLPPPKLEEQPRDGGSHDSSPVPPPRKPVPNRTNSEKAATTRTTRVHECSICRSEFPSGQALGGHMRRHRPAVVPHDRPVITGEVASTLTTEIIELGGPRSNNILALDLNLPAPSDDHDDVEIVGDDDDDHGDDNSSHMVETKFHVLPTPALLDCHY